MLGDYAERITEEYNKWSETYDKAIANGYMEPDVSVAAFMCNAINNAVQRSSHPEVREYFEAHATS